MDSSLEQEFANLVKEVQSDGDSYDDSSSSDSAVFDREFFIDEDKEFSKRM